jgi:DNA repair protein RecO (recombination protein O)
MAIQKIEAIILHTRDFTETSRIVSFATPGGMVRALAKGARRPASPLRGALELWSYGLLQYYPSRSSDLHVLGRFDLLRSFSSSLGTLEKSALFYYLAEITAAASFGAEGSGELFALFLLALESAKKLSSVPYARSWFELQYLKALGVLPPVESCTRCGERIGPTRFFSPREGGWVCPRCRPSDRQSCSLPPGIASVVAFILRGGPEREGTLKLSDRQERSLQGLAGYLIDNLVGKKIKSRVFLDHVTGASPRI